MTLNTHTHIRIHTHIYIYIYIYVCVYICVCVCVYIIISYKHTHTRTYIYIYIYIYAHLCLCVCAKMSIYFIILSSWKVLGLTKKKLTQRHEKYEGGLKSLLAEKFTWWRHIFIWWFFHQWDPNTATPIERQRWKINLIYSHSNCISFSLRTHTNRHSH